MRSRWPSWTQRWPRPRAGQWRCLRMRLRWAVALRSCRCAGGMSLHALRVDSVRTVLASDSIMSCPNDQHSQACCCLRCGGSAHMRHVCAGRASNVGPASTDASYTHGLCPHMRTGGPHMRMGRAHMPRGPRTGGACEEPVRVAEPLQQRGRIHQPGAPPPQHPPLVLRRAGGALLRVRFRLWGGSE